jgi:thrombospondin type 3 repeat protein
MPEVMLRVPLSTVAALALAFVLPAAALGAPEAPRHAVAPGVRAARVARLPVVTSISPRRLAIGHTMTVRGRHFVAGRRRNTVVFQRPGGRFVFVRAGRSSTRMLKVTLPAKLTTFLTLRRGVRVATRFRIRVLARRFGAAFTPPSRSPVITPGPSGPDPSTCKAGAADSDGDGLSNALEKRIHTDPCLADTDGDGLGDFWEYHSALDYNSQALPYPGKRPYPNALDPSDANVDHDGDGMTAKEEYQGWVKCGSRHPNPPLFLSDGTQSSGGPVITPGGSAAALDLNGNGVLTDDERDSDRCDPKGIKGDGLGNWVEAHGPMTPGWWTAIVKNEKPYALSRFAATDWLDADTDGDGLMDGSDDVDHDGWSNRSEVARYPLVPGQTAFWVQPFNPCLPDPFSATCSRHPPPKDESWPPFDRTIAGAAVPFRIGDPAIKPAPAIP